MRFVIGFKTVVNGDSYCGANGNEHGLEVKSETIDHEL